MLPFSSKQRGLLVHSPKASPSTLTPRALPLFPQTRRNVSIQSNTNLNLDSASNSTASEKSGEVEGDLEARALKVERDPWLDPERLPPRYWADPNNRRCYMEWLGQKLVFTKREDWYKLTNQDILSHHGRALLLRCEGSAAKAVMSAFPEHPFLPWLFPRVPKNFFSSRDNRETYIDWLVKKVGVKSGSDLKRSHFIENKGGGLLSSFGGSPRGVLDSLRSRDSLGNFDRQINPSDLSEMGGDGEKSKEGQRPKDYWTSLANQRAFLDSLGPKIGVRGRDLTPWYKIDIATLKKLGCSGLLRTVYDDSPSLMLRSVYPEFDWQPWRFLRFPRDLARDPKVVAMAVDFIESEQKMKKREDWYEVSIPVLRELGVYQLILQAGGLFQVLKRHRSDFSWDEEKFIGARHLGKRVLANLLKRVWPEREAVEGFDLGPYRISYFIPSLKIGFDYQNISEDQGLAQDLVPSDPKGKRAEAEKRGITLIVLDFWTDRTLGTLLAKILESDKTLKETFSEVILRDRPWETAAPIPKKTT